MQIKRRTDGKVRLGECNLYEEEEEDIKEGYMASYVDEM